MLAATRYQFLLQCATIRPGFAEAGGDNDNPLDAMRDTVINGLWNVLERGRDDRQVNLCWYVAQCRVGWAIQHFWNGGVDKINGAGKSPGDQLTSGHMAPFMGSARRAQDSDGARIQHLLERIENAAHPRSSSLSSSSSSL